MNSLNFIYFYELNIIKSEKEQQQKKQRNMENFNKVLLF